VVNERELRGVGPTAVSASEPDTLLSEPRLSPHRPRHPNLRCAQDATRRRPLTSFVESAPVEVEGCQRGVANACVPTNVVATKLVAASRLLALRLLALRLLVLRLLASQLRP